MNKKTVITALVAVALIVGAVFVWQTQGDSLKGFIKVSPKYTGEVVSNSTKNKGNQIQYVDKPPYLKFSLLATSPSGADTVSQSGKVMVFNACTNSKAVTIRGFDFQFLSDNAVFDATPIEPDTIVSIKDDLNNEILISAITNKIANVDVQVFIKTKDSTIAKNSCREFSVYADTQSMITQSANDDLMKVNILSVYGNVLALTKINSNLPLSGNQIRY